MHIIKSKNSGFCFGVKRAVDTAYQLKGKNNYVLGEIIHNESVNKKLRDLGIITINDLDNANLKKGDTLLIRTHGETKAVIEKAEQLGINVIDCTCPFVKEIQNIVSKYHKKGYKIAIIGDAKHPEIIGINGWCDNSGIIVQSAEELSKIDFDKLCVVVQTTFSIEKFNKIIKNFTYSKAKTVDIFSTICYTTSRRQREAEILSKKCDAVVVIGGANSNNTEKLYQICKNNCDNSFRMVDTSAFDYEKLKTYKRVGIVMGASTPIEQFQEVISNMEKITEEIIFLMLALISISSKTSLR